MGLLLTRASTLVSIKENDRTQMVIWILCLCSRHAVDRGSCRRQKTCGVPDALGMQLRVAPAGSYVFVY